MIILCIYKNTLKVETLLGGRDQYSILSDLYEIFKEHPTMNCKTTFDQSGSQDHTLINLVITK